MKEKFSDNPGCNILALFNNLAQVRIATTKTILDINYKKLGTWVAEWLKTYDLIILGNIRKMSNLGGDEAKCPVFLPEIKLWQ